MLKKLYRYIFTFAILSVAIFQSNCANAQSASFNYLSGGLGGTSLTAGNSQVPIYGFSVGVSGGGSITFQQYNLSFAQTSQNYFANGTLYRSSTNSFNSGSPGTTVGNVVFSGNDVTVNNFSETITSGSTNYYFLVLDVIYISGGNGNFYANTANFATDSNGGTSYPFYSTYRFMSFTAGTPYPVRVNYQSSGLASTSTVITSGTTDNRLFEFSVTTSSSYTFSSFKINSNQGTLSNYLTNIRIYGSTTNTFPGGSPIATGTISGSYVNFNSLTESISSTTKYYWIVADCSISGSVPVNLQFNMANGQTNASVTASSPSATYNQFTVYGQTYTINTASLAVTSQQNGLASTTIYPAETGKAVFGFGVSATVGTPTINQININSNNSSLSTYYGNAKLYRSTTNNYTTGSLTLLGSGSISGAFVNFTGLTETMSGTAKYYFLVVDVIYSGGGTNSTAFNFTASQASAAFVQTSPSTSFNTFNITGSTFNMVQAVVNVTSNTNGLIANNSALVYGQTARPVYGFDVAVTGGTTVNSFTIAANGIPAALSSVFANAKLYKSSTNSYTGTLTQVGTANFSGSDIVITGINDSFTNTTRSYFLVVDVVYYGTSGYFQPVATSITTASPSSLNIYQNYYSFTTPPPSFALTGNNSVANGITQGALQYGQTGIVLFGFKLDVMGTVSISQFNIPSTGTSNTFFNSGGTLYRSTTPNFSIGTSTAINTGALSWQSAYVSIPVNESFSTNTSTTTYYYFLVADYNNINASSSGTIKYGFSTSQSPVAIWYTGGASTSPNNVTDGKTFNVGLTYDWVGITSNSFTTTGNYRNLNNGGVSTTPGQYDQLRVGVVAYQGSAIQPTINSDATISKLWFGPNNTPTITLGNADEVNISDGVVLSNSTTAAITGGNGSSAVKINGGTSTIPSGSTLNLTNDGGLSNAGILNNAGTLTVGDPSTNSGTINVTGTGAVTFTSTLGNTGTINQSSSGTSTFTGVLTNSAAGTIQTSSGTINITSSFTNSGTFTPTGGTVNFATDFANAGTGTFSATGGTTAFNRSGTQAISNANTGTPVVFNNLTVSGSNTKTLSGTGTFAVKSSGVVTMAGTAILAAAGKLTLRSDINGSAAVAAMTPGSVTGAVTVQRYVQGGTAAFRGYRLFSSPVYEGVASGNNVYGVAYTKNSAYLTGTSGTGGGFDATSSTPTIYLYREDKTPSSSATGGNFRGINKINNATTYNLNLDNEVGTFNIPVGNGFMFFFRGDRATNASTSTSVIPDAATFSNTGTLNQGTITVKNWYTPASSNLGYTGSGGGGNFTVRGYNLVGNPYAATIDWGTFSSSNSANGIYGPNIANATYIYNAATKSYAVWNGVSGTNGATRYIPSGQGFYVLATGASPSLNFKEIAKVPTQQVTGSNLLMGAPVEETIAPQFLRLQLVKDATSTEDVILQFNKSATENYILGEDLPYMRGSNAVSLSTFATDNKETPLAINQIPLPKKGLSIPLNVLTNATGIYQLVLAQAKNLPKMFDFWLIDAYKKDTIDIKTNKTYSFSVNTADATTFGSGRFSLVVRTDPADRYKLLDFEAVKQTTSVQLRWSTGNEENYTFFTVERSIDGGQTFDVIGSEVGKSQGNYSLMDKNPVNGENQYRLKQEDYFGTVTYSKTIPVTYTSVKDAVTDDRMVSVYPNPSSVNITISIKTTGNKPTNYTITITNTSGRVVKTIQSSQPDWAGNISDLLPGTYFIRVINSTDSSIVGDSTFIKI
jgi:hypothetical protein